MDLLVKDLEDKLAIARQGGSAKARAKMKDNGKLLPRERCEILLISYADVLSGLLVLRLTRLLDPNTPFLELSPLAAHEVYPGEHIPGAGVITGVGQISGQQCVVVVNDATVKGGSYYPLTVRIPLLFETHAILQNYLYLR